MKRLYLAWSSIFDSPDNKYDAALFSRVLKEAGAREITIEPAYGWSNQPDVVTFDADVNQISRFVEKLSQVPPFAGHRTASPIIHEVTWS
jgi:hypothetical protein